MTDQVERELIAAHYGVAQAQRAADQAIERRAMAFALATERGKTSGDISRATGAPPNQVLYAIKLGRRLIDQRRRERQHLKAV